MLDEPTLSRQWVARRLQRALSVERWGAPLRQGLSYAGGSRGSTLGDHGERASRRADVLEALIREVGAEPYGSLGIAPRLTRAAAAIVGRTSSAATRKIALLMAEHTMSEYRALTALVQDAPGIGFDLLEAVRPMSEETAREFAEISDPQAPGASSPTNRSSPAGGAR